MARIYRIKRIQPGAVDWDAVPAASIDHMPWRGMEAPSAQGQVAFDGEAFRVRLKAWEKVEHIAEHTPNGNVWMDNCCEFFFNPSGKCSGDYPCMVKVSPTHYVACHLYDEEVKNG